MQQLRRNACLAGEGSVKLICGGVRVRRHLFQQSRIQLNAVIGEQAPQGIRHLIFGELLFHNLRAGRLDPPVIDIGGSRLCQQSRQKSGGHIAQQSRHRPEQSTLPAAPDTEHSNGDYGQIVEPPRLIHPLFHRNSLLEVHTVDLVVSQQKDIAVLFQEGGVGVPQRNRCQRISVKVVRDNIAGIHDDSISAGHTHALR